MSRRTIGRPSGASFAATCASVFFPFLLLLTFIPTAVGTDNTTITTPEPPEPPTCQCDADAFCLNNTCMPLMNLSISASDVSSQSVSFRWLVVGENTSTPNVSLQLTCMTLESSCSCNSSNTASQFARTITIDGLDSSSLMHFKGIAKLNESLTVSHPFSINVLTLPMLPENVTYNVINTTHVSFSWQPYVPCKETRLEFKNNITDAILTNTAISENSVVVGPLEQGTTTDIKIVAVVTAGDHQQKSEPRLKSVTTKPLPPSQLHVSSTAFSFNVTFGDPTAGQFDYFELEYFANGNWTKVGNTKVTNFLQITDLQPFQDYRLRARTVLLGHFSTYYMKNVKTNESIPDAPSVEMIGPSNVTWKPPAAPNGIILSYEVKWTVSCGKLVNLQEKRENLPTEDRSWTLPKSFELAGYRHCVRVRARNSHSPSDWAQEKCFMMPVTTLLNSTLNIEASTTSSVVEWESPVCPGYVTGYFILVQKQDPSTSVTEGCSLGSKLLSCSNCNSTDLVERVAHLTSPCKNFSNATFERELTNSTINPLHPGIFYNLILYAVGSNNDLNSSKESFITKQVRSSEPHIQLASSDKTLNLTWESPVHPGGLLLHYVARLADNPPRCFLCNCSDCANRADYVSLTPDGKQELENAIKGCADTPQACSFYAYYAPPLVQFENLTSFYNYTVYVDAVNSLGLGSRNSDRYATKEGVPDGPTNVTITPLNATAAKATWLPTPNPRGILAAYFVHLRFGSQVTQMQKVGAGDTSAIFTSLSACTSYSALVTAANSVANSSSVASQPKCTSAAVPDPVENLRLLVTSSTALKAQWDRVRTSGNCHVSYTIELLQGGSLQKNETTRNTNLSFSNLVAFTEYTVRVIVNAKSCDGSKRQSNLTSNSNKTKEYVPSHPENLTCSGKDDSIQCTWQPPATPNGVIRTYRIRTNPVLKNTTELPNTQNSATFKVSSNYFDKDITIYIRASTSAGFGNETSVKLKVSSGPPETVHVSEAIKEMKKNPHNVNDTKTQIRLYYDKKWFNSDRGHVTDFAVIVKKCCGELKHLKSASRDESEDIVPWYKSREDNSKAYIALKFPQARATRKKRSVTTDTWVVVGVGKCVAGDTVCNGPLNASTKYLLYVRGYTQNGYSTIGPAEISTTAEDPPGSSWVIGLVIGLVLSLIIAVVAFFVVRYFRAKQKDPNPGNGFVNPYTPEYEMKPYKPVATSVPQLATMVSEGREVDVPTDKFEEFVEEMNRDSRLKYSDAFNEVKKQATRNEATLGLTTEEAAQQYNRLKNRFANVLPFDQTRVCLSSDDDPYSGMDYINANYVSGYRRQREFIACQGPLQQTLDDFWRMLWEQNVSLVVMLTKTVEKGRNKCEQYWPGEVNETRVYGDIAVRLVSESHLQSHTVRICSVVLQEKTRRLTHLQMFTWNDFIAPTPEDLTSFMRAYRSHLPPPSGNKSEAPTVVHCSAGVGRTGTFICLDTLIRRIESGHGSVNVNAIIYTMRRQRRMLVQSERQYTFIHEFLVSYLKMRSAARASRMNGGPAGDEANLALLDVDVSHVNNAYVREEVV